MEMTQMVKAYGNLMNRIADETVYTDKTGNPMVPEVGMGATVNMYSDRLAGTITKLITTKKGKLVGFILTEDNAERADNNGMSESQQYTFSPDPQGRTWEVKQAKNGQWYVVDVHTFDNGKQKRKTTSTSVNLGIRRKYHDFSF